MCSEAVRQAARALQFVPERRKTLEICLEAVRRRGLSLEEVPVQLKTGAL